MTIEKIETRGVVNNGELVSERKAGGLRCWSVWALFISIPNSKHFPGDSAVQRKILFDFLCNSLL